MPKKDVYASIGTILTLGAILFGHFGDRFGRKNTFVMSLLLMGVSTVVIGLLPTYDSIGIWATILLCLCRIGQGIGLGGEWGGAALVAVENAPEGKRGWYGTFPQLGAPLGLLLANGVFLGITAIFGQEAMAEWAWRIPFLSSLILVAIGLYVRLKLAEAPIFLAALNKPQPKRLPMLEVITTHFKPFFLGMLVCIAGYVLSPFSQEEFTLLDAALPQLEPLFTALITERKEPQTLLSAWTKVLPCTSV